MSGALISGKLGDRFKKEQVLISFLIPASLLWVSFLFIHSLASTWVFAVWMLLVGFASAGFSLTFSLGKEISGHRYSGIGMSIVNGSGFIFTALIQNIYGRILDFSKTGDLYTKTGFLQGNYILIASSCLAALFAFIVYYHKTQEKKYDLIH